MSTSEDVARLKALREWKEKWQAAFGKALERGQVAAVKMNTEDFVKLQGAILHKSVGERNPDDGTLGQWARQAAALQITATSMVPEGTAVWYGNDGKLIGITRLE